MIDLTTSIPVTKIQKTSANYDYEDLLAVEEPLEIRLVLNEKLNPKGVGVSITMRTPGHDQQLALGFLFTEGILTSHTQVMKVISCGDNKNTLKVYISDSSIDLGKLKRNFYTTSSCGVCGKSSIEAIKVIGPYSTSSSEFKIQKNLIYELPRIVQNQQETFKQTGGLHASALFDLRGKLISLFEDVGRHNALDKLIGSFFESQSLPLQKHILLLSGRISFELVQKAAMAGIKCILAIGAPSSLALKLAQEFDITLIGFLKEDRFNIYSGEERIIL